MGSLGEFLGSYCQNVFFSLELTSVPFSLILPGTCSSLLTLSSNREPLSSSLYSFCLFIHTPVHVVANFLWVPQFIVSYNCFSIFVNLFGRQALQLWIRLTIRRNSSPFPPSMEQLNSTPHIKSNEQALASVVNNLHCRTPAILPNPQELDVDSSSPC